MRETTAVLRLYKTKSCPGETACNFVYFVGWQVAKYDELVQRLRSESQKDRLDSEHNVSICFINMIELQICCFTSDGYSLWQVWPPVLCKLRNKMPRTINL
jgi:hypothetical protein